MKYDDVIKKIKNHGYWRIHFQPFIHHKKLSLSECKEVVSSNAVAFRGWDYPHIPHSKDQFTSIEAGQDYYQAWLDWEEYGHIEFWRMFQSGQFIHYRALHEDWREVRMNNVLSDEKRDSTPGKYLGVVGTVYLFTEIFQFLSKLTRSSLYNEGVKVSITLENTNGRSLYVDDFLRTSFFQKYSTGADKILFESTFTKEQIISDPNELALQALMELFERFEWKANLEQLKVDQEKLISRRI
jgi:hypothetical protein